MQWFFSVLLFSLLKGHGVEAHPNGSSLREACTNAFDYGEPLCKDSSTLYWGTGNDTDLSCAHCVCDEGWAGVDCGRCLDVSVCPDKVDETGKTLKPTNCSADTLLLTEEEAMSFEGKVFSCTCGGGEDLWTDALCTLQPDTWIHFAVTGRGTEEDKALLAVREYAGIHARTEEEWPNQYAYHYPKIFDGHAGPCSIYRDKCPPVPGTSVEEKDCVIVACDTVIGACPPEEYPMCEGFPRCHAPNGHRYEVHPCTAVPQADNDITIACQEEMVNSSFVCYYQQSGAFAALSMTCSVGSCLYEGGTPVQPPGSKGKRVAWSVAEQIAIVGSFGGMLLLAFLVFAVATDPGMASMPSKVGSVRTMEAKGLHPRQSSVKERSSDLGALQRDDLNTPLLGQDARVDTDIARYPNRDVDSATGSASVLPESDDIVANGIGLRVTGPDRHDVEKAEALAVGGRISWSDGSWQLPPGRRQQRPAVLKWDNLSYFVKGPRNHAGGEITILRCVSGFAGPEPFGTRPRFSTEESVGVAAETSEAGRAEETGHTEDLVDGPSRGSDGDEAKLDEAKLDEAVPSDSNHLDPSSRRPVPGTMTGMLGPSGAGKSSLLDILAGRKRVGEGRVTGGMSVTVEKPEENGGGSGVRVAGGGAEAVRRIAGYVPQEDVLPGTLTCYEHLMFHARLRMPRGTTYEDRRARVLWIIRELGLTRVADARIGDEIQRGLSGGEMRRLSIAAELVARPSLLFLDEPTTGLDASTALSVMVLLRGVASQGTTILCSLHQPRPRVVNLLDKVILLSRGQIAFFGVPSEAENYFSSIGLPFPETQPQPADAMLTLCCREDGAYLPDFYERSSLRRRAALAASSAVAAVGSTSGCAMSSEQLSGGEIHNMNAPSSPETPTSANAFGTPVHASNFREKTYFTIPRSSSKDLELKSEATVSFWVQVEALSRRLLLRAIRHPLLLVLHFGGSLAMALCLGSLYWGRLDYTFQGAQDRFGALFFLLLYLAMLSLTSLPVWREDRRLFLTETMGGAYGHIPYFTSVVLTDILLVRVVPPLAFAMVAYPLMGLNSEPDNHWCVLWFSTITVLANLTLALIAMGVGALGLPLDLSNLVGGLMLLLMAAFGRFLLNKHRIPQAWRWLSSITPIGYAFEALLINEFSDADGTHPYRIEGSHCSPSLPVVEPLGPQILVTFSFDPEKSTMHSDTFTLAYLVLGLWVISLVIFFSATRTRPLLLTEKNGPSSGNGSSSRRSDGTKVGYRSEVRSAQVALPLLLSPDTTESGARGLHPIPEEPAEEGSALPEENRAGAVGDSKAEEGSTHGNAGTHASAGVESSGEIGAQLSPARQSSRRQVPLLLSWEELCYTVPDPTKNHRLTGCAKWLKPAEAGERPSRAGPGFAAREGDDEGRLVVLDGVSGFAGSCNMLRPTPDVDVESTPGEGMGDTLSRAVEVSGETSSNTKGRYPGCSGTITAIMGPSGAGKTSLLNTLAGRLPFDARARGQSEVTGRLKLNGSDVHAAMVRRVSAYVTQEDVLPETLTCCEHLLFHAHLRLPRNTSFASRCSRVKELLRELALEGVKNARIGGGLTRGISGGEKRRLSIGTELLTRPALLFLDEPTTGLDSSTALRVMTLVSSIACHGTTVLCSLHQPRPEVVRLLDSIVLLSRGRVAFFGAPDKAEAYFASIGRPLVPLSGETGVGGDMNIADAMLDAIGEAEATLSRGKGPEREQRREGSQWDAEMKTETSAGGRDAFVVMGRESLAEQVHAAEASSSQLAVAGGDGGHGYSTRTLPPFRTQLDALFGRAVLNVIRDPYLAWLHVLLTVAVALAIGSLFPDLKRLNKETAGIQDRLGLMFLLLLYLSLLCLTSLAAWRKQMALYVHERASGVYGAAGYLIASTSVDALACRIIPPVLIALIVQPMAELREGSMLGLAGGLIAFNLALAGVLAACGAGARSSQEALAMGCLMVLFSALLSGFLVSKDDLPGAWKILGAISPIGRAFEALVVNEFSPYGKIFQLTTRIGEIPARSDPLSGKDILRCFGFDGQYGIDILVIAAVGLCGLGIAFVLLKRSR